MVREADLYQKALVVRHLNPYRRVLSVKQKAGLLQIAANKRAESAQKAVRQSAATPAAQSPRTISIPSSA
jgi:hypothetical protein